VSVARRLIERLAFIARSGSLVQLDGTFAGRSLSVTARRLESSDYRLFRTIAFDLGSMMQRYS